MSAAQQHMTQQRKAQLRRLGDFIPPTPSLPKHKMQSAFYSTNAFIRGNELSFADPASRPSLDRSIQGLGQQTTKASRGSRALRGMRDASRAGASSELMFAFKADLFIAGRINR
jgi:hypothetical protein